MGFGLGFGLGLLASQVTSSPLGVTPASVTLAPLGTQTFSATGGVGPYVFSLFANNSGGSINSSTGAYIAGSTGSVADTVRVTDNVGAHTDAAVTVSAALSVAPSSWSEAPNGGETFTASGGQSPYTWTLPTNGSGSTTTVPATGTTFNYTAGASQGADVVRCTDTNGVVVNVNVNVTSVAISPLTPTVIAGKTTTFTGSGGAGGPYVYTISTNNSGGSINAASGLYTAGSTASVTDTVRATDVLGLAYAETSVTVSALVFDSTDMSALTPGDMTSASFLSATGLGFLRAGDGYTVQTSAIAVISGLTGNNRPRIGSNGTAGGLVFEESRQSKTNYTNDSGTSGDNGNPTATTNDTTHFGGTADATYADTITSAAVAGPDGVTSPNGASRHQVTSAKQGPNHRPGSLGSGNYVFSGWMKAGSGSNQNGQIRAAGGTDQGAGSATLSTSWTRYMCGTNVPSAGFINCFANDGRAAAVNGIAAHARDVNVWGLQLEAGKFATEVITNVAATNTRVGERLSVAAGSTVTDVGRLALEFNIYPKGSSANMTGAILQLAYQDANNQVWIDTAAKVNVKLNGATTVTLGTAMSWAAFDALDIFVSGGVSQTTAAYRVNAGGTTQLGTGTAFSTFTPSGGMDLLCSTTTLQFTSWVKRIKAYAATGTQKPSWA